MDPYIQTASPSQVGLKFDSTNQRKNKRLIGPSANQSANKRLRNVAGEFPTLLKPAGSLNPDLLPLF